MTIASKNNQAPIQIIGCANSIAGAHSHCDQAPHYLQHSAYLQQQLINGLPLQWGKVIEQHLLTTVPTSEIVHNYCQHLAETVRDLMQAKQAFYVLGGDHSCAIGTWSGVAHALRDHGDIGLIWIDAHMDSHTPETSISRRIHGMPLAILMGHGVLSLTHIMDNLPKLKPENVCLVGVRSFEQGEANLLKQLKVKVYYMDEIHRKGLVKVLDEATVHVSKHTIGFGVSLDLDSIDPQQAPAVDVPEVDGLQAQDLLQALTRMVQHPKFITAEIVEFDPVHDKEQITEKLIADLFQVLAQRRI